MDLKPAMLKSLDTIQEAHPKGSESWQQIEALKENVRKETNQQALYHKYQILKSTIEGEVTALSPQ